MLSFLNFTFIDLLDILMVTIVMFLAFRWIRGTSAINIFIAIVIVLLIQIIASAIGMKMISSLIGTVIDVGAVAIIVIFQPEIRRFLNSVGSRAGDAIESRPWLRHFFSSNKDPFETKDISEIAQACQEMSDQRTGALIIMRKKDVLQDVMDTGDVIDARISSRLIMNIFYKNSPLHDGAMIIGGGRIIAARCTLPITNRTDLPARLGMRHKAAVGISEQSDADVIVVSEQTGRISLARRGTIRTVENINKLKLLLVEKEDDRKQT